MDLADGVLGRAAFPLRSLLLRGRVGDTTTEGWAPRERGEEDGTRSARPMGKGRRGVVSSLTSARAAKQNSDF